MQLSLRYFINKNVRNLLIAFGVMVIITVIYAQHILPTITNIIFAPYELDYEVAFTQKSLIALIGSDNVEKPKTNLFSILNDEQNGKIDVEQYQRLMDNFRNPREFNVEAQSLFNYENVYRQNNRYKFIIRPIDVYDLGLSYETTYTISVDGIKSSPTKPVFTHKYILLDTGKAIILTKVDPDFEVNSNQIYKGVFLPLTKMLVEDVQKMLGQDYQLNNVFSYEFDTLTSFSSYENKDMLFLLLFSIIVLIMGIKLIYYKSDYRHHPTYKQFNKLYGNSYDNEMSLDSELLDETNVIVNKNIYTTEHWIVAKGLFKTKLSMVKKKSRFDN